MTAPNKICPTCGAEYPANERFCPKDGTALRAQGPAGGDLVGSVIGDRYHVLKKLGEGGMGTVYLAEHVKMGRKSAVKVMNPGMGQDADAISRFNREAANASRINHTNVAAIYDFGETADGLIFLAMEYVEGESLTSLVEHAGPLPARRAAEITRQVAKGLAMAHEMGIVHRDLKPDNIMVAKHRDGADCVKVVDFGIAKSAAHDAQKVTRTGLVVGTPEYMSPEQLAGDTLDGRSDVYSLALVTFHMLTGGLPFPSETAQESMIMRLTERPQSLASIRPDGAWTPEIQAVMDHALERDVAARYQTANEFARALTEAVDAMPEAPESSAGTLVMGSATAAVPKTRVAAGAAPSPLNRSRRTPILAGGGVVAVLLLGGAVYAARAGRPAAARTDTAGAPATAATPLATPMQAGTPFPAAAEPSAVMAKQGTTVSYLAELRAIDRRAEQDSTARRALDEADALRGKVTSKEERVYLAIIRAQAYGTLGEDARSCSALQEIRPLARTTSYAPTLARMLANCP